MEIQNLKEEWREIKWWDDYEVSNMGNIRRKKDGKILKKYTQKSGYEAVYLRKNGWVSAVMVHRLVAKAFLPLIMDKEYVDHINTIRNDNRLENLRWASPYDNANNETTKKNRRKWRMTK